MDLDSRKDSWRDRMMRSNSFETQKVREIGRKEAGESRGCSATAGTWLLSGVKRVHSIRRLVTSFMIATFVDFLFGLYINIVVGNFPLVVCNIFVLIRLLVARSHCRDSCACMHRSCSGCNMPSPPSMRERLACRPK